MIENLYKEHLTNPNSVIASYGKIPEADEEVVSTVVKLVHNIRNLNLMKKPSVRGTIDWVRSVTDLGTKNMDESLESSIGVAIKNESDKKRVIKDVLNKR